MLMCTSPGVRWLGIGFSTNTTATQIPQPRTERPTLRQVHFDLWPSDASESLEVLEQNEKTEGWEVVFFVCCCRRRFFPFWCVLFCFVWLFCVFLCF